MVTDPSWTDVTALSTDWGRIPQIVVSGVIGWGTQAWGASAWGGSSGTASDPTAITWAAVTADPTTWTEVT